MDFLVASKVSSMLSFSLFITQVTALSVDFDVTTFTSDNLVTVEQFGMAQCPMTTSWQYQFYHECIEAPGSSGANTTSIADITNFSLSIVGGTSGGPVNDQTWNKSFHGDQEIVADKYQLCAKDQMSGVLDFTWLKFTVCMDGLKGIGICTMYGKNDIPKQAEKCAQDVKGIDWTALDACAKGPRGVKLYHDSVFYTSDENIKYDTPNLPVIRINGKLVEGLDAYKDIGKRICDEAGSRAPSKCGCFGKL